MPALSTVRSAILLFLTAATAFPTHQPLPPQPQPLRALLPRQTPLPPPTPQLPPQLLTALSNLQATCETVARQLDESLFTAPYMNTSGLLQNITLFITAFATNYSSVPSAYNISSLSTSNLTTALEEPYSNVGLRLLVTDYLRLELTAWQPVHRQPRDARPVNHQTRHLLPCRTELSRPSRSPGPVDRCARECPIASFMPSNADSILPEHEPQDASLRQRHHPHQLGQQSHHRRRIGLDGELEQQQRQ